LPLTPAWSTRPTPTTTPTSGTTCSFIQKLDGIPAAKLRTARYHCVLVAARDGEVVQIADRHGRRPDPRSPARHRRLRLRSPVLPARAPPHHGRNRPRNQALPQPSRPRLRRAAAHACALTSDCTLSKGSSAERAPKPERRLDVALHSNNASGYISDRFIVPQSKTASTRSL
jgi:hypothetical protein